MAASYAVQVKQSGRWVTVGKYGSKAEAFAAKTWNATMGRESRVIQIGKK